MKKINNVIGPNINGSGTGFGSNIGTERSMFSLLDKYKSNPANAGLALFENKAKLNTARVVSACLQNNII